MTEPDVEQFDRSVSRCVADWCAYGNSKPSPTDLFLGVREKLLLIKKLTLLYGAVDIPDYKKLCTYQGMRVHYCEDECLILVH